MVCSILAIFIVRGHHCLFLQIIILNVSHENGANRNLPNLDIIRLIYIYIDLFYCFQFIIAQNINLQNDEHLFANTFTKKKVY